MFQAKSSGAIINSSPCGVSAYAFKMKAPGGLISPGAEKRKGNLPGYPPKKAVRLPTYPFRKITRWTNNAIRPMTVMPKPAPNPIMIT